MATKIREVAAPAKRGAVYARYSTNLQNERSIADEFGLSQTTAERMGGVQIAATYDDKGWSGWRWSAA